MKALTSFVKIFALGVVAVGVIALVIANWSYVFSKNVSGKVIDVKRVTDPTAILGARTTPEQMFSYAVLLQGQDGKLYTATSEDRQWQVVKPGYCVDALLYRYPPWALSKANTFFNATVKDIKICPGETALPTDASPGPAAPPAPGEPIFPPTPTDH